MNIDKLSKRLETVVSFIQPRMKIADIGSDHAYLPCYAVRQGITPFAIAGEVVDGPYQSALEQVNKAGLSNFISVRKGDGLEVIEPHEVDCIIIAGMGGTLITNILEKGKQKLGAIQRLILQPNVASEKVRLWLYENNWQLINEELIKEDGKFYEILVAEPGDPSAPYVDLEKEILFGPFLLRKKDQIFQEKWLLELNKLEMILNNLEKAEEKEKVQSKRASLLKQLMLIKEVLS